MNCIIIPVANVLPSDLAHNFEEKVEVDVLHNPAFKQDMLWIKLEINYEINYGNFYQISVVRSHNWTKLWSTGNRKTASTFESRYSKMD